MTRPIDVTAPLVGRLQLGVPKKKWALWHVTGNCNIECGYCYGSFGGSSYKKRYKRSDDAPTEAMLSAAAQLAPLGYANVHLNGGEPLLRKDIWQIINILNGSGAKVWVLTNGTLVPKELLLALQEDRLFSLCFSMDDIVPNRADMLREKTNRVLANIDNIMKLRTARQTSTRFGAYCVLTRYNEPFLDDLLDYLVERRFDYFNIQPVYLPKEHPMAHINWRIDEMSKLRNALDKVRQRRNRIQTSSSAMLGLAEHLTTTTVGAGTAHNCFAARGDYLYIAPNGEVFGCPSKPIANNPALGSIVDSSLELLVKSMKTMSSCSFVSIDCLGMYEMAFMGDYLSSEDKQ